jgi:probable phosphoglycerate mutase
VLWLVRHGETTWNERGLIQGHHDEAVLTDRGVRQAWKVARQLGDEPIRTLWSACAGTRWPTGASCGSPSGRPGQSTNPRGDNR